jgi:hypothetical protein
VYPASTINHDNLLMTWAAPGLMLNIPSGLLRNNK